MEKSGTATADPYVVDYLQQFWSPDSDYALTKKRNGKPLSIGYIRISAYLVGKHLAEPLKTTRLSSLGVPQIEKILNAMAERGSSGRTQNAVIAALRVPVTHWARQHRAADPLEYLSKSADTPRARGTLSLDEIRKIIAIDDESPRVVAAVLLGALCGLRLGEARGLQWADIDRDAKTVHVQSNWVEGESALKGPKCGSRRDVPLPDPVLEALDLCVREAPYTPTFALWNEAKVNLPFSKKAIEGGLARVLRRIGIDDQAQVDRNLVFHGLRHLFVSLSRATGLPDFAVMRLAGHKSAAMMEHYSHSDNVVDFADARERMATALAPKPAKIGGAS
ncbi:MAG TPA: site-specific integrase [Rectinemataceae bacterium]|nr:site-specific integrase [Rectinemataceae bacterium]